MSKTKNQTNYFLMIEPLLDIWRLSWRGCYRKRFFESFSEEWDIFDQSVGFLFILTSHCQLKSLGTCLCSLHSILQTGVLLAVLVWVQQVQMKTSLEQFEWRWSRPAAGRPFVQLLWAPCSTSVCVCACARVCACVCGGSWLLRLTQGGEVRLWQSSLSYSLSVCI